MQAIVDQPPPIATLHRPSWEIVISYIESTCSASESVAQVLADMRSRDQIGRERYGMPLTAGNGRDHLVDAYQELLDGVVYLATELEENGSRLDVDDKRAYLQGVQQLFHAQIRAVLAARQLIASRGAP